MIPVFLSRLIILAFGTLYPAYRSYKAIRTKAVKAEYVKWMMYWIVFAFFNLGEAIADTLLSSWFPFYYDIKVIFVLWLLTPWTEGTSIFYRMWVHPLFMKHEDKIDTLVGHAKSESYRQVIILGNRGLMCAKDIVVRTALQSLGIERNRKCADPIESVTPAKSVGAQSLLELAKVHQIEENGQKRTENEQANVIDEPTPAPVKPRKRQSRRRQKKSHMQGSKEGVAETQASRRRNSSSESQESMSKESMDLDIIDINEVDVDAGQH